MSNDSFEPYPDYGSPGPLDAPDPGPGTLAAGLHPVHVSHLVMGIAFWGLLVVWALVRADVVTGDDIRWLLPVPFILAGVAGLAAATRTARRRTTY